MGSFYKLLLAALVAFVFLMLVNALLVGFIFPEGSPEKYQSERSEPKSMFNALGLAISALLMAYMYPKGYAAGTPWTEGLRFGMVLGLLVVLPLCLHIYARVDVEFGSLLTVILWTVVTWGISGALIGSIYGKRA